MINKNRYQSQWFKKHSFRRKEQLKKFYYLRRTVINLRYAMPTLLSPQRKMDQTQMSESQPWEL